MTMAYKICIIGQGNVSWHLHKAFTDARHSVMIVSSRATADIPKHFDFYIIAVSDDAISEVAASLPSLDGIIMHTSGSVSIRTLAPGYPCGVLYPLQTFSKGIHLDYSSIPFFIEASDSNTLAEISALIASIGAKSYPLSSEDRKKLHLAAVMSANFSNALYAIADEQLKPLGLDFSCLEPLLAETIRKAAHTSPLNAQTGPARRGDYNTISSHLHELEHNPQALQVYKLLTAIILRQHGNPPLP